MAASVRGMGRAARAAVLLLLALVLLGGGAQPAADAAPLADEPPAVTTVWPEPRAQDVATGAAMDGSLSVSFNEPVALEAGALEVACERSGLHIPVISDGPVTFSFTSDRPFLPGEQCLASVRPEHVSDLDADDPPDRPISLVDWPFRIAAEWVLINELDAVSAGDLGEFVELYDGGRGDTDLGGLSLVLYGVDGSLAYLAMELDGFRTDEDGYFVIGDSGVVGVGLPIANGIFLDAAGAVAIYDAPADAFPMWSAVSALEPVDAVVYGAAGPALLTLLRPEEPPLDEDGRGAAAVDSNQRCPDGGGLPMTSGAFILRTPTPGGKNDCPVDAPPKIAAAMPAPGSREIPIDAIIEIEFSEEVVLDDDAIEIACSISELHAYSVEGDGTSFEFAPDAPFVERESCTVTVFADRVADADTLDPPNYLESEYIWTFHTVAPVAENVVINEVDADTPGIDSAEFVELFDGGAGDTALDGLSIVLFNGEDDRSYLTLELDGYATDAAGYFVIGNESVGGVGLVFADGLLQNGPDAVALVVGGSLDYPDGTAVTDTVPFDAFVYSRPAQVDPELQLLLEPGQPQVNENGRGDADAHSSQRCPNGAGGLRMTAGYKQNTPTPGAANDCITDKAPAVISVSPAGDARGVGINAALIIEFNEPVTLAEDWLNLSCESSDIHTYQTTGGPSQYSVEPDRAFHYSETCSVAIQAALVSDLDADDPPDVMADGLSWSFTTADPPADFVLINEIDPNTPGDDEAEFIEIFDGGIGRTRLDGLVLVFFNGNGDRSYRVIDLGGSQTDERGYFVIGNSAVNPDITIPNGALQNGPDAVALYVAERSQFPSGTAPRQSGLVDAVVYGDASGASSALLSLLLAGQDPIDEGMRGSAGDHSLQRCPNGGGGQRQTAHFIANRPTPGAASDCTIDDPPRVSATLPVDGATAVSIYGALELTFSEPVKLAPGAVQLTCSGDGRGVAVSGGPQTFRIEPVQPLPHHQLCRVQVKAVHVTDTDHDDPPDHPADDFTWSFSTAGPPPDFVLINEIDADTPGNDTAEFIELFDGGVGRTDLSGLVLVFYNGSSDRSYRAIDLTGAATNAHGYLVIGNPAVAAATITFPNGTLQNGADAVALFAGSGNQFASGTPVRTQGLIDAVVYGTDDPVDTGLLGLLAPGEKQVDESGGGAPVLHSSGRCPNGQGGQRKTAAFRQGAPSPGAANNCIFDDAPTVIETRPADGASGIDPSATLMIRFSEEVVANSGWFTISCDESGEHAADASGGPRQFMLTPRLPFNHDERCEVTIKAARITDADQDDPPDQLAADFTWSFRTSPAPPVADFVVINELDADTPGSDTAEFIELFDGGAGHTDLSGLVLVFYNGSNDLSYHAIDLDGTTTSATGYLVAGNPGVTAAMITFPNGTLQNGADAVALFAGDANQFRNGTPVHAQGLIDAVVYGVSDPVDAGLLGLLLPDEKQVDENGSGSAVSHSSGRCPNGGGGQRRTASYRQAAPSPGLPNNCVIDEAPAVTQTSPAHQATGVDPSADLTVRFSEDVVAKTGWFAIVCSESGVHAADTSGGPMAFTLVPRVSFEHDEQCEVTIIAAKIADADNNDPPDQLAADFTWSFRTSSAPPVADFVVINELDADTPGSDTAEFIELYDGGAGHTSLDGLLIVFWNGDNDKSYRVIGLAGHETDAGGYFVIGNRNVSGVDLVFADDGLQNGPDAVGLYAGRPSDFPNGSSLTTDGLIDAVVYGPVDNIDAGLLVLLELEQFQLDEAARGDSAGHSLQRCPDGAGGARKSDGYRPDVPTPGAANVCRYDEPPEVASFSPAQDALDVLPDSSIEVEFSEDVAVDEDWYGIDCDASGPHAATASGGPRAYEISPAVPFAPDEWCEVTLLAAHIHDVDTDDPPDHPAADVVWHFRTMPLPSVHFTTISPLWIGETAEFSSTIIGPGPLAIRWDFGDGSPSAHEANVSHVYARPGVYVVTLEAGGPAGTAIYSETVVIRPRAVYWPVVGGW